MNEQIGRLAQSQAALMGADPTQSRAGPTDPGDVKPGSNDILVKSVQYGLTPMIMEKDVPVRMSDGITLYLNVFRPVKPGRYPVVMSADIYGKDAPSAPTYGMFRYLGVVQTTPFASFESPDPGYWVPNDYVVVKVALRGSSNSEGAIRPLADREAEDYAEVIEWAARQEWSSGSVGIAGVSYLCMAQWKVAALNPPHLKAMIPWEGLSDLYREWAFHGGIPDTGFFRSWVQLQRMRHPGKDVEPLDVLQGEHPLFDDFWREKQAKLDRIRVPMLVGASWATQGLHTRGTLEGFKQSASAQKWLFVHGRKEWETYYSREALEIQKRFFDHFLKGIENDWMDTPRVQIEVREGFYRGAVRAEEEWPLARTRYTPLYLDGEKRALSRTPLPAESRVVYSTEAKAEEPDSASFEIRFPEDTEITGYMKLRLWVAAPDADDMDLFVGVKKLDRRGNEVHMADFNHIENGQVASGWLRVSHRELDPDRSTPYQPWLKHERLLKLRQGEIVPVEVEIMPSSTLFRAGESLRLVVQGRQIIVNEGLVSQYRHDETVNRGRHVIHAGGGYDSHLLVPVIPPKER